MAVPAVAACCHETSAKAVVLLSYHFANQCSPSAPSLAIVIIVIINLDKILCNFNRLPLRL